MNSDEKLICAVREYPELYDSKHRHYYDIAHRERLWEKIAEILQEESAVVKKRWTYLRDCYRKSLKKGRHACQAHFEKGTDNYVYKFPRRWKYYEEMSFLQYHICFGTKKPKDDQTDDEDRPGSERGLDTGEVSPDYYSDYEPNLTNDDDQDPFEETETVFVKAEPTAIEKRVENQKEANPTKKLKTVPSAASSSMGSHSDLRNDHQEVKTSDNISTFFKYMEETVRGFHPLLRIEAKSKFSQLLSELEMKNLMNQQ